MTVKDLIYHAMRLAQITKVAGREANTYEFADALATLNAMLDAWNAEGFWIPRMGVRDLYTLEAGKASYTLGPDADWNAPRPFRIEGAGIIIDGREQPLDDPLTFGQWAEIRDKAAAGIPSRFYDDGAYPAANVYFHPVPQSAYQVALYVWDQILKFASTDETVLFPAGGYEMAVRYGLAVELAAANPGNSISPLTIAKASEYKAAVKRKNFRTRLMGNDAPGVCRHSFDIMTGDYR